ncbi:unnamed protein product [Microthlaspi erraticum]|uniref:TF-B3 domain-containing protein n=1 Tax=Microthlaspi erraticum TaxID=1685480 RepID=A0A6D2KUS3_9BRAS|nr:unnamed protein product [Microthlaspi erraticum]
MAKRENGVEEELMPLRKRPSLRPPQQQVEELPERFKNKIMEMRGTEERLIFKRKLTKSDVDKGASRLSIPMSELLSHSFLTSDEKEKAENLVKEGREGRGLTVQVIDPRLRVWELKLRRVVMEKRETNKGKRGNPSSSYWLGYKWNYVVKTNSLREGNDFQLWSFRSQQKLCLALVLLRGEGRSLGN